MKFCLNCANRLTTLKAEAWTHRLRCDRCGARYLIIVGDSMGGASDEIKVMDKPFDSEEVRK